MALKPLKPALEIEIGECKLLASAAGRTSRGLTVALFLERGTQTIEVTSCSMTEPEARRTTVTRFTELTAEPSEAFERALLELATRAEGALRRVEAQPVMGKADQDGTPRAPFGDPEPWPVSVQAADLLDEVALLVQRFVVLAPEQRDALALFVAYTHTFDSFDISPYLGVTSATMRCGKTRLMTVLAQLVQRPLPCSNATPASIFRSIERWHPTLLIDEGDTFLRLSDEMRGILNSGHTRGAASILRVTGDNHDPQPFSTWSPKAFALIGQLPPTLLDRSIVIGLRRKRPSDNSERLRSKALADLCGSTLRRLTRYALDQGERLREADPSIPQELNDRAADNWAPLLAIADDAGGSWPQRARRAALMLSGDASQEPQEDNVLALFDVALLLQEQGHRLSTVEILAGLVRMDERPWSAYPKDKPITARVLAGLLRPFDIRPTSIRIGPSTPKGYALESFEDALSRYGPATHPQQGVSVAPKTFGEMGLPVAESEPQRENVAEGNPPHVTPWSSEPSAPPPSNVAEDLQVAAGDRSLADTAEGGGS